MGLYALRWGDTVSDATLWIGQIAIGVVTVFSSYIVMYVARVDDWHVTDNTYGFSPHGMLVYVGSGLALLGFLNMGTEYLPEQEWDLLLLVLFVIVGLYNFWVYVSTAEAES